MEHSGLGMEREQHFVELCTTSFHPWRGIVIHIFLATLAQLVEHLTCNEDVVGSIPTGGSIL